jgi:hypothetical protein
MQQANDLQLASLFRHNHPYSIKPQITGIQCAGQLLQLLLEELDFFVAHVRVDLPQRFEAFDFRGGAKPLDSRLCANDG